MVHWGLAFVALVPWLGWCTGPLADWQDAKIIALYQHHQAENQLRQHSLRQHAQRLEAEHQQRLALSKQRDATNSEGGCRGGTICDNTCLFAFDGHCDDGSDGSAISGCAHGTDCHDCGKQKCAVPTPAPSPAQHATPTPSPTKTWKAVPCEPGYFRPKKTIGQVEASYDSEYRRCTKCPVGTFMPLSRTKAGKTTVCVVCPIGKMSFHWRDAHNRALEQATTEGAFACTACAPGTFSHTRGVAHCKMCTEGHFSHMKGAVKCQKCAPGKFQPFRSRSYCKICPNGRFQPKKMATKCERCKGCAAGQYRYGCKPETRGGMCLSCPLGKAKAKDGRGGCASCKAGTFQSVEGKRYCLPCAAGRYADYMGSTVCESCKLCPTGTFRKGCVGGTRGACSNCPAGKFKAHHNQPSCTQCPSGKFQPPQKLLGGPRERCLACLPGFFQSARGSSSCQPCPACSAAGRHRMGCTGATKGACFDCEPGKYSTGAMTATAGQCAICLAGRFTERRGTKVCSKCPRGKFSLATGVACVIECPVGSFLKLDIWQQPVRCELCAAGRYGIVSEPYNFCQACPAGRFSTPGARSCTPCAQAPCPRGWHAEGCGLHGLVGTCVVHHHHHHHQHRHQHKSQAHAHRKRQKTTIAASKPGAHCCDPLWQPTNKIQCTATQAKNTDQHAPPRLRVSFLPPYTFAEIKKHYCKVVDGGGQCRCCICLITPPFRITQIKLNKILMTRHLSHFIVRITVVISSNQRVYRVPAVVSSGESMHINI